jgi:hypothetical protein
MRVADVSPSRSTAVRWTIGAVVLGLIGLSGIAVATTLGRDSAEVPARVVATSTGGRVGQVIIVFTTKTGERVRAKVSRDEWDGSERPGATVRVRYVLDDPAGTVESSKFGERSVKVILAVSAGALSILVSCYLWIARFIRSSRRRRASPLGRSGSGTRQYGR